MACRKKTACPTNAARAPAPCTPPWPWWPARASATSTNSSRSETCPACACCGRAAPPIWPGCGPPTRSSSPPPNPPPPADRAGLRATDWVILPGSKATAADLAWLRAQGLDQAIATHAAQGGMVLGICGGLQMLGEALIDSAGIDGNAPGLGLLPLV